MADLQGTNSVRELQHFVSDILNPHLKATCMLYNQSTNSQTRVQKTYLSPIVFQRGKRVEKACVMHGLEFVKNCGARQSRVEIHVVCV